jgi:pyrroloquinoline quinone (PQQ) biosynthesis protein C
MERKKAMKWLRVHAHYDDTHPWEALEIIATLVGTRAGVRDVASIRSAILRSYEYMLMAFDDCLARDPRQRQAAQLSAVGKHLAEARRATNAGATAE